MNTEWLKKKRVLLPAATLLAFGIGVGAGFAGTDKDADSTPKTVTVEKRVEVPGPERIVTKDVPGPERIVTVTKTPTSCLTALDLASDAFGIASKSIGASGDAAVAAANRDVAAANRANKVLQTSVDELTALSPKYLSARDACRASK